MVTLSDVPTLTGWESRRRRRSSGVRIIDDTELGQVGGSQPEALILADEPETLPRGRRVPDPDADVVTIPQTMRSSGAPAPRLIPIDLTDEPVTVPMARRPEEPILQEDEAPTSEMRREDALRRSDVRELRRYGDVLPCSPDSDEVFDLDSLLSDVDSFQPHPAPAASSWPAQPPLTPASPSSFPGRPFAAAVAPTSQTDRPDGPTLAARAVSVLVAVAVVSVALLAAAMIVADQSGVEAFTDLYSRFGGR